MERVQPVAWPGAGAGLLWGDPGDVPQRAGLLGDARADVAIVGAGFTGLWTAFWLLTHSPGLRVVVLEREHVGFGASGRNGGWASALFPASRERIAAVCGGGASGQARARDFLRLMRRSVADLGQVSADAGIDCDWAHGGALSVARSRTQWQRALDEVRAAHAAGDDEGDLRLLDRDEAARRLSATDLLGATYTPHCAVLHPGRLVRGLAAQVERLGGVILERTPVVDLESDRVHAIGGTVRADRVVRATEAYTADLLGQGRRYAPVYSLMVATEPLDDDTWARIGLAGREAFTEHRNLVIYGQRTADGRIAFGGRGAPYHWGSRTDARFDRHAPTHEALRETLCDLLPALRGVRFTHAWGGPLGIPRDWFPSCGIDPDTGIAWSGGYVGDGVTSSFVGGRTLADLLLGRDTEYVAQPWVGHRSPAWEQEPLRWLGINAARIAMTHADRVESSTGRPSLAARVVRGFTGH